MQIKGERCSVADQGNTSKRAMVTFSFDDGREDTFRVAFDIMKEYGLVGTIHVITGWVDGSWSKSNSPFVANGSMNIEQIKECYDHGFEITSHGDKHCNDADDLKTSLGKLIQWGVVGIDCLGFSSPNSELTIEKRAQIEKVINNNNIKYVRIGRSSKCYSLHMKIVYLLQLLTCSKRLFRIFNEYNSINSLLAPMNKTFVLPSSIIKSNNSAQQVIELLQKSISDKSWNILMLHSILQPQDEGYGKDPWHWGVGEFRELCQWLSIKVKRDISVVTIKDGIKAMTANQHL